MGKKNKLMDKIESVMFTHEQIISAVDRIADEINNDYDDDCNILLLGILKGCVVFMSDLMKKISLPVDIDFMKISSYSGTVSTGKINILLDLHREDLSQKDIIIVEDIIDSGRTLSYLVKYLKINGARSIKTCTLLDKPSRRTVEFTPDYIGFEIPDAFVVGYGLDYDEYFRTLPFIGILKPEVYKK